MGYGEDEGAAGSEEAGQGPEQRLDSGHVHQGHGAHGLVEAVHTKGQKLLFIRGIQQVVLHAIANSMVSGGSPLRGSVNELLALVKGDDTCPKRRHASCEAAGATGNIEDEISG